MTRNLKALGLALLAVFAIGAIGAQGASAADAHEFHADGEKTVLTGKNTNTLEYQVGAAGTIKCTTATVEGTVVGTKVTDTTWKSDEITLAPRTSGCEFGGQPATVKFNRCDKRFDSDTTEQAGTATPGKHASLTTNCQPNNKIEIHTVNCTITIGAQEVPHAVRYENVTSSSFNIITTMHKVVVGKERNTAAQPANGCLLFPTGAVGKFIGTITVDCRKDEDEAPQADPTTPTTYKDQTTTACTVTDV